MIRVRFPLPAALSSVRRRRSGAWHALLVTAACWAASGLAAAGTSIGVVPFEGDGKGSGDETLAGALAEAMAERDVDRLLLPGRFVASPGLDASAADVREWAYAAAVEALVFGAVQPAEEGGAPRLVVSVRSGHSGAERARHALDLPRGADREAQIDALAGEILSGLGHVEPLELASERPAPVAAEPKKGRGLDGALDLDGFDGEAPIQIEAEEAEIVNKEDGREIVFVRNVSVRQANITLQSERLEALYQRGESEPERLVARGKVFVDQGGRQARCDRAIYVRSEQQLTCSGRAELVQGCDIVRGDSIQFWLADDRARVEGAASIVIRPEAEEGVGCEAAGGRS